MEETWQFVLNEYIKPLIWKHFRYDTKKTNINFVVKYSTEKQKKLEKHHDSSTYTINLCLNNNFDGGGCNFILQNRTIINKDIGSFILHPGKLTHLHEGLPITNGKRYIFVSFVN